MARLVEASGAEQRTLGKKRRVGGNEGSRGVEPADHTGVLPWLLGEEGVKFMTPTP